MIPSIYNSLKDLEQPKNEKNSIAKYANALIKINKVKALNNSYFSSIENNDKSSSNSSFGVGHSGKLPSSAILPSRLGDHHHHHHYNQHHHFDLRNINDTENSRLGSAKLKKFSNSFYLPSSASATMTHTKSSKSPNSNSRSINNEKSFERPKTEAIPPRIGSKRLNDLNNSANYQSLNSQTQKLANLPALSSLNNSNSPNDSNDALNNSGNSQIKIKTALVDNSHTNSSSNSLVNEKSLNESTKNLKLFNNEQMQRESSSLSSSSAFKKPFSPSVSCLDSNNELKDENKPDLLHPTSFMSKKSLISFEQSTSLPENKLYSSSAQSTDLPTNQNINVSLNFCFRLLKIYFN